MEMYKEIKSNSFNTCNESDTLDAIIIKVEILNQLAQIKSVETGENQLSSLKTFKVISGNAKKLLRTR